MIRDTFNHELLILIDTRPNGLCVYKTETGDRITCRPELLEYPARREAFSPVTFNPPRVNQAFIHGNDNALYHDMEISEWLF